MMFAGADFRPAAGIRIMGSGMPAASIALDVLPELLVLIALEFDEILVDDEPLIDSDGPRLRIRLGIFERQVNLQVVVCRTADFFRELRLLRIRTAIHINPTVIRAVFGA